jgi:hypothetical protein
MIVSVSKVSQKFTQQRVHITKLMIGTQKLGGPSPAEIFWHNALSSCFLVFANLESTRLIAIKNLGLYAPILSTARRPLSRSLVSVTENHEHTRHCERLCQFYDVFR